MTSIHSIMKINNSLMLILAFAFIPFDSALALSTDRDQAAQIEADETEIDFKTGTRVLTNNVLVIQGTLRLKADKLVAKYDSQGQLINATANGSLARFKQRPDGEPNDVEGWGKTITIDYPKNTLTLTGQASLRQGASTARGNKIVYNMATDKLKIIGDKTRRGIETAGKDGKKVPKRTIKDPFADDEKAPPAASNSAKKSNNTKSTTDNSDNSDSTNSEPNQKSQPSVEPVKSGRSRLILQPRKKNQQNDKK